MPKVAWLVGEPLLTGSWHLAKVGQNRIYTPYMAVYLVIS